MFSITYRRVAATSPRARSSREAKYEPRTGWSSMSQQLISRSPDLKRLRDEGYDVKIQADHLVVADVPYINEQGEVARGALISTLSLAGDVAAQPSDHVVSFRGDYPCDARGSRLTGLVNSAARRNLGGGLEAHFTFSRKPAGGYVDYFHKMTTYVALVAGPAEMVDPTATAKTSASSPPRSPSRRSSTSTPPAVAQASAPLPRSLPTTRSASPGWAGPACTPSTLLQRPRRGDPRLGRRHVRPAQRVPCAGSRYGRRPRPAAQQGRVLRGALLGDAPPHRPPPGVLGILQCG